MQQLRISCRRMGPTTLRQGLECWLQPPKRHFGLGQERSYEPPIPLGRPRKSENLRVRLGQPALLLLELTARAGYDPQAGITFWQKMLAAKSGSSAPSFLSSHPTDANRLQTVQALLPTVTPLYLASRRR